MVQGRTGAGLAVKSRGIVPFEESRALLAAIVESSDDAIVSKTLEGIITSWNDSAQRIFGYSRHEVIGEHISILIPPERLDEEDYIIGQIKKGGRVEHFETVRRHKDGQLIDISLSISPIRNDRGEIIGASKIARDISDRRRLEESRLALAREVNHRSKNLLAVVQAIVGQTAQQTPPGEVTRRVLERLQVLSVNQDLLIEGDWEGIDMRHLAARQLPPDDEPLRAQFDITGDSMMLTPVAAQAIGMALHELKSNALAHGALTLPTGRVQLGWSIGEDEADLVFRLEWQERDGPPVSAPERSGFGHRILNRITAQAMNGRVEQRHDPEGYYWVLVAPATTVLTAYRVAEDLPG